MWYILNPVASKSPSSLLIQFDLYYLLLATRSVVILISTPLVLRALWVTRKEVYQSYTLDWTMSYGRGRACFWLSQNGTSLSGPVAQWITRLTTDQKIPGSTPGWFDHFYLCFCWDLHLCFTQWYFGVVDTDLFQIAGYDMFKLSSLQYFSFLLWITSNMHTMHSNVRIVLIQMYRFIYFGVLCSAFSTF